MALGSCRKHAQLEPRSPLGRVGAGAPLPNEVGPGEAPIIQNWVHMLLRAHEALMTVYVSIC